MSEPAPTTPPVEPAAPPPAVGSTEGFVQRLFNNQRNQTMGVTLASSIGAVIVAFVLCAIILWLTGKDPIRAYSKMFEVGFTRAKLIETVQRASPLALSAVAVAIGFKMNMFNIGVEGQYLIATMFAAAVGAQFSLPAPVHIALIIAVAMTVGALSAGVAAVLKVTRGVNEVVSTIMLNFVTYALIDWLVNSFFRDRSRKGLDARTKLLPKSGWMPNLIDGASPLSGFVLVTLAVVIVYWLLVFKSRFGYRLRASGVNPNAARTAGIGASKMIVIALLLSGAVAGLIGLQSLLGDVHAYGETIPKGYGFSGIAVALLGRNHPAGIVPAALLFGFLNATSSQIQLAGVPSPIIEVMQAVILFSVVIINEVVGRWHSTRTLRRTARALRVEGAAA